MDNILDLDMPMTVTLGNISSHKQYFQPYKEDFTQVIEPGDAITFTITKSSEALYYTGQATKDIVVGLVPNGTATINPGVYDADSGEVVSGSTSYSFIQDDKTIKVIGVIPYAEADASLGLAAGNRFAFKLNNPFNISEYPLPNGIIAKVTNTLIDGYNEYTKAAFDADGGLSVVSNVPETVKVIEVMVKWTDEQTDFITYTLNIDATLEPAPVE